MTEKQLHALLRVCVSLSLASGLSTTVEAQDTVHFATRDGGSVGALYWQGGEDAVVLAHGRVFNKESWNLQSEALLEIGLTVLAIDFRGYGDSRAGTEGAQGLPSDVLAAIDFLEQSGASSISLVGGSVGGYAAGVAATVVAPGRLRRLLLLAPPSIPKSEDMSAERILLVVAEGDPAASGVRQMAAQGSRELVILEGADHAQHIFSGSQGAALTQLMLDFLKP